MARTQYCVVLHRRRWKILLNGSHYGPYATQSAAIEAAIQAAKMNGQDSQVLVQDEDGTIRTEWIYGEEALALSA